MNKKEVKMKKKYFVYAILIIIILVALIMVFVIEKSNNINKNNEIKENLASNSVEENITENNIPENIVENNTTENNNKDTNQYKILGTYKAKREEGTEAFVYVFSENSVIFASDAWDEGTYTINGNKIEITYTVTHSPVDSSPMDYVRKPEELTIEDENTLVDSEGEKFYKTSDSTTWGEN